MASPAAPPRPSAGPARGVVQSPTDPRTRPELARAVAAHVHYIHRAARGGRQELPTAPLVAERRRRRQVLAAAIPAHPLNCFTRFGTPRPAAASPMKRASTGTAAQLSTTPGRRSRRSTGGTRSVAAPRCSTGSRCFRPCARSRGAARWRSRGRRPERRDGLARPRVQSELFDVTKAALARVF